MGFKNAGFPDFRFNPLGFKSSSIIKKLVKECGLQSLTTPLTDKTGKSDREAVQGKKIEFNKAEFIDTNIIPGENDEVRMVGNFNLDNNFQAHGVFNTEQDRFMFGVTGSNNWNSYFGNINSLDAPQVPADSLEHEFILNKTGFYVDGEKIYDHTGYTWLEKTSDFYIGTRNKSPTPVDGTVKEFEYTHNGITYTLNTDLDSNYRTQLVANNNSQPITAQGFLTSPSNIVEDIDVLSLADEYGVTFSDGVNYFYDDTQTNLIPNLHPIPANEIGLLQAYDLNGDRGTVDNIGRIKINLVKCDVGGTLNPSGLYVKLQGNYHHIAKYDDNRILTEADGTPKILEIVSLINNTNNQFFADVQGGELVKAAFYETSLVDDCLIDALKLMGFSEVLTESDGSVVIGTDGVEYVYKTGISLDTDERTGVTK